MNNQVTEGGNYNLNVAMLFEKINKGRKMRSLSPVENSAIASRINLRFNIGREERLDFNQESVALTGDDVEALEEVVNEQFDCMLDGDVKHLCHKKTSPKQATQKLVEPSIKQRQAFQANVTEKSDDEHGLMSKIKKIFASE